jgi:hypothetical protein
MYFNCPFAFFGFFYIDMITILKTAMDVGPPPANALKKYLKLLPISWLKYEVVCFIFFWVLNPQLDFHCAT